MLKEKLAAQFDFLKAKAPPLVGCDISSSSVKMVEIAEAGRNVYRVERYAIEPLPKDTVVDGNIANIEAAGEAIKRAHKALGSRIKNVALALPARRGDHQEGDPAGQPARGGHGSPGPGRGQPVHPVLPGRGEPRLPGPGSGSLRRGRGRSADRRLPQGKDRGPRRRRRGRGPEDRRDGRRVLRLADRLRADLRRQLRASPRAT